MDTEGGGPVSWEGLSRDGRRCRTGRSDWPTRVLLGKWTVAGADSCRVTGRRLLISHLPGPRRCRALSGPGTSRSFCWKSGLCLVAGALHGGVQFSTSLSGCSRSVRDGLKILRLFLPYKEPREARVQQLRPRQIYFVLLFLNFRFIRVLFCSSTLHTAAF